MASAAAAAGAAMQCAPVLAPFAHVLRCSHTLLTCRSLTLSSAGSACLTRRPRPALAARVSEGPARDPLSPFSAFVFLTREPQPIAV